MAAPKKAPAPDARRDLEKELAAAAALKYQLGEAFGDDHDVTLIRDMIEGETNLDGAIDMVLGQMAMDLANIEGIKHFETTMEARRKRLSNRVDAMRTMLLNALDIVELKRIERPIATVVQKPTPPKVVITDEAAIPTRYYKQPDPELSKTDLLRDLKDQRDTVAGKLGEIVEANNAGTMTAAEANDATQRVLAAFPPIPGAELSNGGATVQITWS